MASAELKSDPCEAPEHSGLPGDSVLGAWRGRGTLTAGLAGAVDGGHPQVGGAGVKDDGEVLSGGADADGAEVLRLPGAGGWWWAGHTAHRLGTAQPGLPGYCLWVLLATSCLPLHWPPCLCLLIQGIHPSFKSQPDLPSSLKSSPTALPSTSAYSLLSLMNTRQTAFCPLLP